ncbi:hypothetical protein [Nocardia thailandica]|uniref:hypothetical protein n=1 Tax=Nocardia thailandica TaxID=257275 RepID=UPI0002DFB6D8|nr:hypothetical protein [Nocardia thailandica]
MHAEAGERRLPHWHELSGVLLGGRGPDHPITGLARVLAKLHSKRWPRRRRAVADVRRRAVIDAIDMWVAADLGTPGIPAGALIDEMARAGAQARQLLATTDPSSDAVHAAWTALATLADQWPALVQHLAIPYSIEAR